MISYRLDSGTDRLDWKTAGNSGRYTACWLLVGHWLTNGRAVEDNCLEGSRPLYEQ